MQISIYGNLPECEQFEIACDNQTKLIDSIDKSATFEINNHCNNEIVVEQKKRVVLPRWLRYIFLIVTLPLQGLFNIITFNSDSSWENNICPYRIKAILSVNSDTDEVIYLTINKASYCGKNGKVKFPTMEVNPDIKKHIEYIDNFDDVDYQFKRFIIKFMSIVEVFFLIFAFLLYNAIISSNVIAIICTVAIICASIAVMIYIVLFNYKKKRNIFYELRNNSNKCSNDETK